MGFRSLAADVRSLTADVGHLWTDFQTHHPLVLPAVAASLLVSSFVRHLPDETEEVASTAMPADAVLAKKTEVASPGMPATTSEVASPSKAEQSDLEILAPADPTGSNVSAVAQQSLPTLAKSTGLEQMPSSGARKSENQRLVDAFIAKVSEETERKITRQNIVTVAGYKRKSRSELYRFEIGHRCTENAKLQFRRVLSMTPEDFVSALQTKSSAK